jgi:hypothetical protein
VKVADRHRAFDEWVRQHWVGYSLVLAASTAIGWLVVGLIVGSSYLVETTLILFGFTLGMNLFVRGWWSPDRP